MAAMWRDDRRHELRRADDKTSIAVLDQRLVAVIEQQSQIIKDTKEIHAEINARLDKAEENILTLLLENRWLKKIILMLLALLSIGEAFNISGSVIALIK